MSDLQFITYVEVDEEELDGVEVNCDTSPAEPDVNWGGSFEILSCIHKGTDVMPRMTDAEIESVTERLYQQACNDAEDYRY